MEHMNSKHHMNNVHVKLNESSGNIFQQQHQQQSLSLLKPTTKASDESTNNDCCLLAHRDYFHLDAYHSKIIERSLQSSVELKYMKLKQTNFKTEIKKSNQMLKQLKQEYDKKQSILGNETSLFSGRIASSLGFFI